ncbi:hypothetical protein EZV62_004097 [Acer yangbiense]|uniref:Cyclin N-terminal domain-containing protein n=1 Tax=Acer yangbiense TaxID=1000413 RepID=A0A5C7IKN2_9ROSI|nr:hypothetical protein EZV62_004097 [Acer yangbiense]
MKSQNSITANVGDLNGRITRARAAALRSSGDIAPSKATTEQNKKRVLRGNPKRAALDENTTTNVPDNQVLQRKRRAVLQDVTNVVCENSYMNCFNATKIQAKNCKQAKRGQASGSKVASSVSVELQQVQANSKPRLAKETMEAKPEREEVSTSLDTNIPPLWLNTIKECGISDQIFANQTSRMPSRPRSSQKKGLPSLILTSKQDRFVQMNGHFKNMIRMPKNCVQKTLTYMFQTVMAGKEVLSENLTTSCDPDYVDIDSDHTDPQLCSLYAADMHTNLRVAELKRRPSPNFMEKIQHDITQSMRGILVDWLVEVSEEYKLEPDTLYLTVYLIDWFLSQNYIERQRLQLLGITCMMISSKYEEICAPRIEEFCFITDNTYSRDEVLKMESRVIKFLGFQLFAPTAKTFLRRFLRAAQASYKSPSLELEYLANFLAELSLVDYGFLNFLPSVIAASSVFLARWTLDQSSHPWNATLEHYTYYRASDLKIPVFALQDLQLNTKGCPLNAIRMKYRQEKFKSVAALSSPKLLETLF